MKISVIVPVYNVEKYLADCIDSILGQTYPEIEIILINDGSTDRSGKICDAYATKHPNIKVIHKTNAGVSAARNTGLLVATGDYIHFCDADDTIETDTYSNILSKMIHEDADVAYFGWRVDAVSQTEHALNGVGSQYDIFNTMLILCGGFGGKKGYGNYIWNKIYKATKIKDENGAWILFDESVRIAEDGLWLVQVAQNWNKGIFDSHPYYHYLKHQESVTNTPGKFVEVKLASQDSHKKMLEILKAYKEEYYLIHRDACIQYFWHVAKAVPENELFVAQVIANIIEINDGQCPANIAKDFAWYMKQTALSRKIMNRRLVKMAIGAVKKLDEKQKLFLQKKER